MLEPSQENAAQNTYRLAQVTDDEALATQPLQEESLKNGRQWVVRDDFTIDTGQDVEIIVSLPEESDDVIRAVDSAIVPDSAVEGEVTFNRDIETEGTELSFVNSRVAPDTIDTVPDATVQSGGNYINPAERNGEVIELPLRSTLGVDPQGPGRAATTGPAGALYRIAPGGSVHFRVESTEDNNTIQFSFILSQREKVVIE